MMDPADVPRLRAAVSEARFSTYLSHYKNDEPLALRLYTWNLAASTALWGPIAILEVIVRNAIHTQLFERTGQETWWNDPGIYLCTREQAAIDRTLQTLRSRGNSNPSAGDVVGASSFGLWVGLTGAGKARDRLYDYETRYWQPRLHHAFPHLGTVKRKQLHSELDAVRKVRNRIAHHEPIFNTDLTRITDDVICVAGYIDADIAALIASTHRVDAVLEQKRAFIANGQCTI